MDVFYLSPASGTQLKVVKTLKYPYVLVNFMTRLSKYIRRYAHGATLFVDSGGFPSSFIHNGYNRSDAEYLFFVKKVKAKFFALRDYPCEPQLLKKHGVTVRDQIHRTLDHHIKLLELFERQDINSQPIPVIQGWEVEDYLYCIDMYEEHGLIFDYMAVGSTCRRQAVKETQQVILAVRDELPNIKLHAFGVKLSVLNNKAVWDALYSADSSAWDYWARFEKRPFPLFERSLARVKEYLARIEEFRRVFECQSTLADTTKARKKTKV